MRIEWDTSLIDERQSSTALFGQKHEELFAQKREHRSHDA